MGVLRKHVVKTANQVEAEFKQKLKDLLLEYDAELSADDHWTGYAECGQDIRMIVSIPSIYNKDTHECEREYTEIDLGRYL